MAIHALEQMRHDHVLSLTHVSANKFDKKELSERGVRVPLNLAEALEKADGSAPIQVTVVGAKGRGLACPELRRLHRV